MNSLLSGLSAYVPAALTILCATTVLLIAGFAVQHAVRRSPAARHAVLLWTLIAIGLCPILIAAVRMASRPGPIASRVAVQRMSVLLSKIATLQTAQHSTEPAPARHLPISGFLLGLWATGAFISLLGLVRGLRITGRIRRSAQPISAQPIEAARSELHTHLSAQSSADLHITSCRHSHGDWLRAARHRASAGTTGQAGPSATFAGADP